MDAYLQEGRLDERIAALADAHHGIVDVDELRALGASRTQIGRRLDARRLIRLHRGVYAVGHRRLTNAGVWLAAVKAIGPGAALSDTHAAALHLLRAPLLGRINVTVRSRSRRQRRGIRVHATLDLPPEHTTVIDSIPVTTVARTLADLAGTLATPALMRAIEAAQNQGVLDVPAALEASAGRTGARRLARLLEQEPPHTRSEFEAAFNDLCDRHRLPRPVMNTKVHGLEVDCYWADRALVVELDSYRFHSSPAKFERDKERDAELHAHGLTTLRFTYRQVTTRAPWVARTLRPTLTP